MTLEWEAIIDRRAENTPTARKNSEYSSATVGQSGRPRYKNKLTNIKLELVTDGGSWGCFLIRSLCTYTVMVAENTKGKSDRHPLF